MRRDGLITTAFWLFPPTVVLIYTQHWQPTLIALGIMTIFMPLQLWFTGRLLWDTLVAAFARLPKRKAGEITPEVSPMQEGSD